MVYDLTLFINKGAVMTSRRKTCLCCGQSLEKGSHACPSNVTVVDPMLLCSNLEKDGRTNEDELIAQGDDINEVLKFTLDEDERFKREYPHGDLVYRVEFINVSGLGFQGVTEYWAFIVEGREDSDIERAVLFLNQPDPPILGMAKGDTYLCRLSSFDRSGIRYVWKIKHIIYDGLNKMWVLQ